MVAKRCNRGCLFLKISVFYQFNFLTFIMLNQIIKPKIKRIDIMSPTVLTNFYDRQRHP